jgi:putative oxygen-independent coproporphyrinogen III oxidase
VYGVYAHVPWCRVRCPYCAFAVDTRAQPDEAGWVTGVLADWARESPWFDGPPATLAFGGGTPSRANPRSLEQVVEAVRPTLEVGMEVNPEDVTAERVREWRALGVSRLSLGVQTFDATLAPKLGRAHSARQAVAALDLLMSGSFRSVSVDLMFGQEGQGVDSLLADLALAVSAGVQHLSLYALTIEAGTRFSADGRRPVHEDRWVQLHDEAARFLGEAGLERYEVSNFAGPGHRAVHNEHYWRARHWAGLGPSAHGWRPDGSRTANAEAFDDWALGAGPTVERPTGEALLYELLWSTLRHVDGVDIEATERKTGRVIGAPDRLLSEGILWRENGHLRMAASAFAISDAVVRAVFAASCRTPARS